MSKTRWTALAAGLALLMGCSQETKESAKADVERGAEQASKGAKDILEPVQEGAESAVAATTLTPRLKAAITADAELNNPDNRINVDSNKDTVTLDGHVETAALKSKAEQVVRAEMAKAGAKQTLVNNLEVHAH